MEARSEIIEAPDGFEPSNGGFADLSLSHLGTAPEEHFRFEILDLRFWSGKEVSIN